MTIDTDRDRAFIYVPKEGGGGKPIEIKWKGML